MTVTRIAPLPAPRGARVGPASVTIEHDTAARFVPPAGQDGGGGPASTPKRHWRGRGRRFLQGLFWRRFSLVDLCTWVPLGGVVSDRVGLFAGLVCVVIVAVAVAWLEGKVNDGKTR